MHQETAALTARATYAFSARLTLQLYNQVFLSGGKYAGFSEVVDPTAMHTRQRVTRISSSRLTYDTANRRYQVDTGSPSQFGFDDPGFSERDLNLNLLLRWEFRPGSTLFLVWTHQRTSQGVEDFQLDRDLSLLWRAPGVNAVAAKVSFWIGG